MLASKEVSTPTGSSANPSNIPVASPGTSSPSKLQRTLSGGNTNNSAVISSPPTGHATINGASSGPSTPTPSGGAPNRKRQVQKDENLRKRAEHELHRRSSSKLNHQRQPTQDGATPRPTTRKGGKGTVAALQPNPPITILHTANIVDACQYMSAKRTDSLLVVDSHQRLCGIMTDKDVAFKVVGDGLDPLVTKMAEIMTPSPVCVSTQTSATEALSIMVTKHFRHLPVLDDEGDVVGILDITKCLFDALTRMERMENSSRKLTDALEMFEKEFSGATPSTAGLPRYVEIMRQKMLAPSLEDVMQVEDLTCPTVSFRSNVREAARMMKETRSTAVAIVDQKTGLSGILTTKDIVLRVVASKAYPHTTSVVRVMTPRPDTVGLENTVLEALQMMHENRYLHLPLQDDEGRVVGMADVLKLTNFVLQKLNSIGAAEEEPLWNQFWSSTLNSVEGSSHLDSESNVSDHMRRSLASAGAGHHRSPHRESGLAHVGAAGHIGSTHGDSIIHPTDSVSQVSETLNSHGVTKNATEVDDTFVFKFRDLNAAGSVYRLTARSYSLAQLIDKVQRKLGSGVGREVNNVSYVDDEGDLVNLSTDADLVEAVSMAKRLHWPRLMLLINEQAQQHVGGGSMGGATPVASIQGSQAGSTGVNTAPSTPAMTRAMRSMHPLARDPQSMHAMGPQSPRQQLDARGYPRRPDSRLAHQNYPLDPNEPIMPELSDSDYPGYRSPSRRRYRRRPNSGFFERAATALNSEDPMANLAIFVGSGATVGIAIALTYLVYSRTR